MNSRMVATLLAALGCLASSVWGIQIQFDYSYDTNGFFTDPIRRDVMQAVADSFEPYLMDDLLAITPGGANRWDAGFFHPATGDWYETSGGTVPADTLIVYVGGRDLEGGALGQAGPGGYSARGTQSFLNAVTTRGEGTTSGASATDFGPWGGSAAFDTGTTWYFDPDPSTDESFTGYDFYSVAAHEIGHVLGFGTSDSWANLIVGGDFTGTASTALYGGSVPLAADAHWYYSTQSTIGGVGSFEVSMDPNIGSRQRKRFTDLDFAGLDDLGWDVIYPTARLGDFDGDGDIDADDIDALGAAAQAGSTDLCYDMDGDSDVDADDFAFHIRNLVDTALGVGTGTEFGDFNLDGVVGILDLGLLGDGYSQSLGWADGDANGDGTVGILDLGYLGDYYGYDGSAIPEPMTMSLLVLGAVAALKHRRL
jgi:hypothetical protein